MDSGKIHKNTDNKKRSYVKTHHGIAQSISEFFLLIISNLNYPCATLCPL